MKKRLLSLVLALVLIIGMLPVTTIAAATRYRVTLMYGTDYALQVWASNEGEVTYTKNKEVTFTDSEGTEFTGWVQENVEITDEQTEEWNTKYYYDSAAEQCVLVLKGAKLDSYNNPAQKAVSSSYAIYGLNVYNSHSLRIEIMEDSIMEATTIVMANGSADSKLKDLEVISHGNAKLSCDTKGYFAYMQASFVKLNANIEYNGNGNSFLYLNKSGGYYQIDGGHLKVSAYRFTAHSNSSYSIYLNGGSLDVTTTNRFAYSPVKYAEGLCYTAKNASGTSLNLTGGNSSKRVIVETYESHVLTGEVTDCTAGGTCATCGATVAGRAAHEAAADDDNCVTAITCKYCDVVMVEGNAEHEPGDPTGNCAVPATCKNCSVITTPAKDHTPKDAVIENEDDKSYESVIYCDECGNEVSRETISKLCPHTNSTFLSQVDSTCTEDGVAYYYCNDCEENYDVVIPASGHNHVAGTPVAPTILAQGYTPYICDKCGDTYNSDFQDILWAAASIGERGFDSLKEAVEAAEDGDIILLRKNIKEGEALYIDKDITINFNGGYYSVSTAYQGAAIVIAPDAEVTLWNGNPNSSSKLMIAYSTAGVLCCKNFNYLIINNGTLHVKNLTLNGNNAFGNGDTYTIENSGIVNLNEDTVVQARVSSINNIAGTVTKAENVEVTAPKGYHFNANTGVLEAHSYIESLDEATVYDIAYLRYTCVCGDTYRTPILGSKKLPPVAKNTATGKLYATVQEAVDEAENGQTIEMVDKVQNAKALVIPADLKITIDMKGFYYATKVASDGAAMVIEEGADLRLISSETNSAVKVEYVTYWMFDSVIKSAGNLTIENVTVNGNNLFNEGSCAVANEGAVTLLDNTKITIRKNDPRVEEFGGEGEITDLTLVNAPLADLYQMEFVELEKTASAGNAITVHPGSNITYTITITNNNDTAISVNVVDTLPKGAAFVSGCADVRGTSLYWSEKNIAPGETRTITYQAKADYTLAQIRASKNDVVIKNTTAKAITTTIAAPAEDIWVLETFNATDIRRMEMAIDAMVTANLTAKNSSLNPVNQLSLISMMYNVGFTVSSGFGTTDPAEVLTMIYEKSGQTGSGSSGGGEEDVTDSAVSLVDRVVPTLYGGTQIPAEKDVLFRGERATSVSIDDLVSGDVIVASNDGEISLYIVDGPYLVELREKKVITNIDPNTVLPSLPTSDKYAVIRLSINLNITFSLREGEYFNDYDKQEYTDLEKALIATAEAYLLRGDRTQYTDDSTGTSTNRAQSTLKQPEDYTVDQYGYTNCAYFTYDVHWATYGVAAKATLSSSGNKQIQSTTTYLADAAKYKWDPETKTGGNKSTIFYCTPMVKDADGNYVSSMTAAEQAEVKQYIIDSLRPGDIICIRRQSGSGHAMLYVGNGMIIHSSGSNYSRTNKAETHEASIRFRMVADLFDASIYNSTSYVFNLVSFSIVRLQNLTTNPTITENTQNRVNNMQGIIGEKLASTAMGKTVNPGDTITYTFAIFNTNKTAKEIAIRDVLSEHVTYVSASHDATVSGSDISWNITVPADTRVEVTYTVKVKEDVAAYTCIDGSKATINGVSHDCINSYVANTLTAEQQQTLVEALNTVKGMDLTGKNGVDIANLIYKTAFGIENLFGEEVTNGFELVNGNPTSTIATATNNIGIFNDSTYWGSSNTTTVAFKDNNTSLASKMVAPGMFGGGLVYTTSREPSTRYTFADGSTLRARLFWEKDLIVGDIYVQRGSSSVQMYVYIGNDTFVSIGNGFTLFTEKSVAERFQYAPDIVQWKFSAVLRPSMAFEEI